MMRTTKTTAALCVGLLALTACGGGEEQQTDAPVGEQTVDPGLEENQDEPDQDDPDDDQEEGQDDLGSDESEDGGTGNGDEADQDSSAADDGDQDPQGWSIAEEYPSDAEGAYELALDESQQRDEETDFSEYAYQDDSEIADDEWADFIEERNREILLHAAEIMTEIRPTDWNRDVSTVRASHLMTDEIQLPGVPERPNNDDAQESAYECNAVAEPRVAMLEETDLVADDWEGGAHDPFIHIVGEYRWVDGDDGCNPIQPDHYFLYSMDLDNDALITVLDTEFVDYGQAPNTVPEPESEDPGLFG